VTKRSLRRGALLAGAGKVDLRKSSGRVLSQSDRPAVPELHVNGLNVALPGQGNPSKTVWIWQRAPCRARPVLAPRPSKSSSATERVLSFIPTRPPNGARSSFGERAPPPLRGASSAMTSRSNSLRRGAIAPPIERPNSARSANVARSVAPGAFSTERTQPRSVDFQNRGAISAPERAP
jgi:hypothetical protein